MNTAAIRKQLHNYLEIADDKKINAIFITVEDDIKDSVVTYTEEYKAELGRRVDYYLNNGKMGSPVQMNKKLNASRRKRK